MVEKLKMKNDELIDYILSKKRKRFWQYSAAYYAAHVSDIARQLFWRAFCLFGYHREYDGINYNKITIDGEKHFCKTYLCRYCGKPEKGGVYEY